MSEPIVLGEALDTVIDTISAKFPTFNTTAGEDQIDKDLPVPAILVSIAEIEPDLDQDGHNGQFPCIVRLEAQIVLGARNAQVRRNIAEAAGAVATFLHSNRLGVAWGAAAVLSVEPDEFAPGSDRFEIWRVEWGHSAHLGATHFDDEGGKTPSEILTSWAPETGPDHEAQYTAEAT